MTLAEHNTYILPLMLTRVPCLALPCLVLRVDVCMAKHGLAALKATQLLPSTCSSSPTAFPAAARLGLQGQ